MVFRLELTFNKNKNIHDMKYIDASSTGYTLPPGIYESSHINFMLKSLLPDELKVNFPSDDIRLKSNLTTRKTIRFTDKSFFHTVLGFSQPNSDNLGDIKGFIELISKSYKSDKPINITGIDKMHIKCDSINGSILNGIREPICIVLL